MRRPLLITAAIAFVLAAASALVAKEITVQGRLQKTVESGGWLIASGKSRYLILNARSFQNESWFKESTEVEAVGNIKPDVVTTYMEGTPFEVTRMHPVEQKQTGADGPSAESLRLTRVMVSGDSIVQAQPDTAILTISVVTQGKRAIDAQQENASKSDAVVRVLKDAVGPGAEVKTSGYSLQPQRVYRENQPPNITGYEARNSVTVTTNDLTKVGMLIDAAGQAGANDVAGVSFKLKQDRPARDQALKEATRVAVSKAQVIARALGGRVVRIVEVQEEGFERPRPVYESSFNAGLMKAQAQTPIEVGSLDISSRVQLVAEVETNL
jgi:uncharacterized protein YggE